jgi:hypothetical protein
MSSRSLAAARARRAGENAPPVSGNRPGTSIGSQAAFVQPGYQPNMPPPPPNVRVGRGQQQPPQNNAYQQVQQSQQQTKNGLPFSKLSISDAIGLITLRLGRVEQWVIETEHENETNQMSSNIGSGNSIDNNSVLTSIINRLDSLEKKEPAGTSNSSEEITKLTEQLTRISDEGVKHNLAIAKHTEQLFRFERELVETKDILKTFMIKYDLFASETNNRFTDFEYALADLEKVVQPAVETLEETNLSSEEVTGTSINDIDMNTENGGSENISSIMSVDLKNIIKQELAATNN